MRVQRHFFQVMSILILLAGAAAFQIHSHKLKKVRTTAISTACTLEEHYQHDSSPVAKTASHQKQPFGKQQSRRKKNIQTEVVFCLDAPITAPSRVSFAEESNPMARLQEVYQYLYFKEINPPPPKSC